MVAEKSGQWLFIAIDSVLLGPGNRAKFGESPNYGSDSPYNSDVTVGVDLLEASVEASWQCGTSAVDGGNRGGGVVPRRRQGKCPLTPGEVGLMLRALGYGSDVHIYVASGEVYIATKEELAPFSSFSSRMAALDFIVCDERDVFVTNNNGNMARILAGRRKYFGHKPTIRPNAKKLYRLFLNRNNMTWEAFASCVRTFQRGFMGEPKEVRPGRGEFHENPTACICEDSEAREKANVADLRDEKNGKSGASSKK
ncbi:hypothetical protein F3Y22_tig00110458pilonHSYRG00292 [Hibiscus syriacus]|uniref:O-fucosyltransferase family protein n=1 Tax=Hibiscus syriacus TaxID=106335 RepID=A0A6A3AK53_HIBSY|nr:hypothetical protein F3Y22_tig00110458pilonHSYRG00292 [Hibiscus syriacus]